MEIKEYEIWFSDANERMSKIRRLLKDAGYWIEEPGSYDNVFVLKEHNHETLMDLLYGSFRKSPTTETEKWKIN